MELIVGVFVVVAISSVDEASGGVEIGGVPVGVVGMVGVAEVVVAISSVDRVSGGAEIGGVPVGVVGMVGVAEAKPASVDEATGMG